MGGYRSGNNDKKKIRNPDRPFEDMEGNWIGLGKEGTPKYNKRTHIPAYYDPSIDEGLLETLKRECEEGNEESCKKVIRIEEQNKDHLERLMAIANYDEEPPKLREPKGNE